jgi:hypothetical protein
MKETTNTRQSELLDQLEKDAASIDRKPFVEPSISPASDVFEVTKNFLFMMMMSGAGKFGGNDKPGDGTGTF